MPVRPYEIVYIIDPDVNEENTGALVDRFRALAEAQGATEMRVDTHTLGRRRLAYEINHKREGQYVVMNFQSEASAPDEVERVLNITDSILRSMVIRLEEMPPEPPPPPAPPAPAAVAAPAPEASEAEAAAPEAAAPEAAAPEAEAPEAEAPEAEAPEAEAAAEPTGPEGAPPAEAETPAEVAEDTTFPTPLPDEGSQGQELTNATEADQPEADQPEADQPAS